MSEKPSIIEIFVRLRQRLLTTSPQTKPCRIKWLPHGCIETAKDFSVAVLDPPNQTRHSRCPLNLGKLPISSFIRSLRSQLPTSPRTAKSVVATGETTIDGPVNHSRIIASDLPGIAAMTEAASRLNISNKWSEIRLCLVLQSFDAFLHVVRHYVGRSMFHDGRPTSFRMLAYEQAPPSVCLANIFMYQGCRV